MTTLFTSTMIASLAPSSPPVSVAGSSRISPQIP